MTLSGATLLPLSTTRVSALIYIFRQCAFKRLGIKEIVKRNSKAVTKKFDGDNAGIMTIAINNVFHGGGWNAGMTRQGVDVVAVRRAELLNAQRHQLPSVHSHIPRP